MTQRQKPPSHRTRCRRLRDPSPCISDLAVKPLKLTVPNSSCAAQGFAVIASPTSSWQNPSWFHELRDETIVAERCSHHEFHAGHGPLCPPSSPQLLRWHIGWRRGSKLIASASWVSPPFRKRAAGVAACPAISRKFAAKGNSDRAGSCPPSAPRRGRIDPVGLQGRKSHKRSRLFRRRRTSLSRSKCDRRDSRSA